MKFFLGITIGLIVAWDASADFIADFRFDTSGLIGHPAGPFSIDLQLNDGSGSGNSSNHAIISMFNFGGGGPVGSPLLEGGASGDLSSTVDIIDSGVFGFNEFIQTFVPGDALSFRLSLTTNVESGLFPDQFSVAILDSILFEVPTTDPSGFDRLLSIDINSASPQIFVFGGDTTRQPFAGGGPIIPPITRVPEPSTFALLLIGLATVWGACRIDE